MVMYAIAYDARVSVAMRKKKSILITKSKISCPLADDSLFECLLAMKSHVRNKTVTYVNEQAKAAEMFRH